MSKADKSQVPDSITPELRDGFEVHAAALRHGLDVALYPRQVLIVRDRDNVKELSFVHGLPESAGLGPVTYAQDKRMRRALFEAAGLPIPRGVTFSVGRGVKDAKAFAAKIGYPVVVKPAIGDNAIETFADLTDELMFDEAIDKLRVPPSERETFTRAAYGLTELREPGEEDGRVVVPPGYRFLVEDHVHGVYLRTVVLYGKVYSAVLGGGSPSIGQIQSGREVLDEVHPSILRLAERAVAALPGIPVAAVDFVLDDHRKDPEHQELWIVEFSERPGLAVQAAVSEKLSQKLGDRLLELQAEQSGISLKKPRAEVAIRWRAEAIPDPAGAHKAVEAYVQSHNLLADIDTVDPIEGILSGTVKGSARTLALLSESLMAGRIENHRSMYIKATALEGVAEQTKRQD